MFGCCLTALFLGHSHPVHYWQSLMETVIEIPVLALHMPFEFLCSEELPQKFQQKCIENTMENMHSVVRV